MATGKHAGKKSVQQNDFLAPYAPTIGIATNIGVARPYNNGSATVTFVPDSRNAADSYTVTSYPDSYTAIGSSSPITITGLRSGVDYTFKVTATNSYGTSNPSFDSAPIKITTVPAVPISVSASSPNPGYDDISWTAPENGGEVISNYHWESDDGKTGDTSSTSFANIGQEQGTAQSYRVYATNVNGNSEWSSYSNQVTTTFSFVPFGALGFSPFGAFGFSPFGAFGFSPFGAFGFSPFGFSPFGAFGFSPFGAFGFSPFGFSPYAPRCIAGQTKIATVGEDNSVVWVEARHIRVGDKVFSPVWDEFDGAPSPYESRIEYDSLTNKRVGIGEIEYILEKIADNSIVFNSDLEKHFSTTQPVLARKQNGKDAWEFTGDLSVGDIIWEYDFDKKEYVETKVDDANLITTPNHVFQIGVKGIDTFIAGGVISHNK